MNTMNHDRECFDACLLKLAHQCQLNLLLVLRVPVMNNLENNRLIMSALVHYGIFIHFVAFFKCLLIQIIETPQVK